MNNHAVTGVNFCQPFPVQTPTQDPLVQRWRQSSAFLDQEIRILRALDQVLNQPGLQQILNAENPVQTNGFESVIKKALQDYSRKHGALKLANDTRSRIGKSDRPCSSVDQVPVSLLRCSLHGSLEEDGSPSEVSGTSEVASHELGLVDFSRSMTNLVDHFGRKKHVLELKCELAPNVYESPISALVLGLSQDLFVYSQLPRILNHQFIQPNQQGFRIKLLSGLGVPARLNSMEHALQQLETRVFAKALPLVYSRFATKSAAARYLTAPVANMLMYKAQHLMHDTPLGVTLYKYLKHGVPGRPHNMEIAQSLDQFQGEIRACRTAIAPFASIGRAYFNTQFRNMICEAMGLVEPKDVAAFDLRVRAYRELRTEGRRDAPVNNALLDSLRNTAPPRAVRDAQAIVSRSSGSEPMLFRMDDLD